MAEQERKRDIQISVRLSEAEYDQLIAIEESTGEARSVLVRRWIKRAHKRECE